MYEQVAAYARAVIAVVAPAEQAHRLEGNLRRASQKPVPIDGRGRGIGRNRILPRADRVVAIPPRLHHVQLADRTAGEKILGLLVHDGAHALAAHLENPAGAARGLDHLLAVVDALHHRFLAVHVLARAHGVDGDLLVPVVGRPDDHRVHVPPRQHLAIIAGGENVRAPPLLRVRQAAVVNVGDGDQLGAGRDRRRGVAASLSARADQRDLDAIVGGFGILRLSRLRPERRRRGRDQQASPGGFHFFAFAGA